MKKFYVTTPIYYVNGSPHIGHAYTSTAADVLARFKRLQGDDVFFLTGTDEHGQKVQAAAVQAGIPPQNFVDKVSADFQELSRLMNISNDDFIRTSEPRHKTACRAFWGRLVEAGAIYLGSYDGWYAARDEAFYDESELVKQTDGSYRTKESDVEVQWVSEPSYFFAMSEYTDKVLDYIEKHPNLIQPESKRNEILSILRSGDLRDLSISRTSFSWGIPVPGDPKHVMYVWLDALVNYLSALGFPDAENPLIEYWAPDVHIVGKEIIKFHAIYWLAFLIAADISLPKKIFSHGWWTMEGKKISKSAGNALDVRPLVEEFGVDAVRYYLLREIPFGNDGNFSRFSFEQRYNSELANDLGNLAQRCLSFISSRNLEIDQSLYNDKDTLLPSDYEFLILINKSIADSSAAFKVLAFQEALVSIWKIVSAANVYFSNGKPWASIKTDETSAKTTLYFTVYALRGIAYILHPIMPQSMDKLLVQIGLEPLTEDSRLFDIYKPLVVKNLPVSQPLFPKKSVR